jgi:hypothetical protein
MRDEMIIDNRNISVLPALITYLLYYSFTAIAPYQSENNADNEGGAEAEVRFSGLDDCS